MAGLVKQSDAVAVRLPTEIGLLAASLARRAGKPLLVEVVGSASEAFRLHGSLLARLYAPVIHRRMQRAVRAADIALYVTQRWLQSQYPSPNAVVDWDGDTDHVAVRAQAGVPDAFVSQPTNDVKRNRERRLQELAAGRPPVFGTMAVLGPRFKGIQFALAAFAQIARTNGRPFQYRILGPGDPRPWQQMIHDMGLEDYCHLDGVRQPGQQVLEWLDNVDDRGDEPRRWLPCLFRRRAAGISERGTAASARRRGRAGPATIRIAG
jgi:glycosyltransferase involved in cell wall biosynthesis